MWGATPPMDPTMYKSQQAPEIQNFQEPKYVKNANLTASNEEAVSRYQTPSQHARKMTQSQQLKTHSFQPERNQFGPIDPIGPGAYNVEASLDYTKPRNPSPDLGHQLERQSPARLDSISPDQYEPKIDFVKHQSPKWTIGPKHGPLLDEEDADMVNMGASQYETNAGGPVSYSQNDGELLPNQGTKARPKSTLNSRRKPTSNARASKGRTNFGELDSYNDPPKFGSTAKGMANFGAPKLSVATSKGRLNNRRSTNFSRTTAPTRAQPNEEGMSFMTPVVFEENVGPDLQEE